MDKFKKGDRVKVWSLQSWSGGGFLNGETAVVRQDQTGESVILIVVRKINGEYRLDTSYEIYAKQCELIEEVKNLSSKESALLKLEEARKVLLKGEFLSDNGFDKQYV